LWTASNMICCFSHKKIVNGIGEKDHIHVFLMYEDLTRLKFEIETKTKIEL